MVHEIDVALKLHLASSRIQQERLYGDSNAHCFQLRRGLVGGPDASVDTRLLGALEQKKGWEESHFDGCSIPSAQAPVAARSASCGDCYWEIWGEGVATAHGYTSPDSKHWCQQWPLMPEG